MSLIHEMTDETNKTQIVDENGFTVGVEEYIKKASGDAGQEGPAVEKVVESYEDAQFKSNDNLTRKNGYWNTRRTKDPDTSKSRPGNKTAISYEETDALLKDSSGGLMDYVNNVSDGIKNVITPNDPSNTVTFDPNTGITTVQSGETKIEFTKKDVSVPVGADSQIAGEYLEGVKITRTLVNGDFEKTEDGVNWKRDENGNLIPSVTTIEATSIVDYINKGMDAIFQYIANSNKNLLSLIGFNDDDPTIFQTTPDGKTLILPQTDANQIRFRNNEYKGANGEEHEINGTTLFDFIKKEDKELFARVSSNSDGNWIGDLLWTTQQ